MIVYSNTKGGFVDDVRNGIIAKKIIEEFNEQNDSSTIVNSGLYEWNGKQVIFMENIDDYEASGSYGTICLYAKIGEEKIATLVGAYNNKDDRDEVLDVMKILERSVNMS